MSRELPALPFGMLQRTQHSIRIPAWLRSSKQNGSWQWGKEGCGRMEVVTHSFPMGQSLAGRFAGDLQRRAAPNPQPVSLPATPATYRFSPCKCLQRSAVAAHTLLKALAEADPPMSEDPSRKLRCVCNMVDNGCPLSIRC